MYTVYIVYIIVYIIACILCKVPPIDLVHQSRVRDMCKIMVVIRTIGAGSAEVQPAECEDFQRIAGCC